LVFATRRTNIDDSLEVQKIIKQDNYEEIDVKKVLPGDIIIYYADDNDAEHSGIVISVPDDVLPIPNVISKWGQLEEYIHPANQCPYHFINAKYYRMKI
jgi:hypothetical protein